MRVGYFINQYPAVSHTFIRREIKALELLGVSIVRYALRPGDNKLVDKEDEAEAIITKFVLRARFGEIVRCCFSVIISSPVSFTLAVREAIRMGWRSDRGMFRHLIYVLEAIVLASWCRRDKVEHVHAHFGTNSAAIAMLSTYFSNLHYSFTIHGPDEFDMPEFLSLGAKLKGSAFAVCVSSYGRSQLMRWSSPDQWHKIEIVHCGVNSVFLDNPVLPPGVAPRLVCVGRLGAAKGQMVIINAVRKMKDAGIPCEIVLVGDGPFRERIEAAIARAGLPGTVRLIGWASGDRVKEEMMAARALVMPSFAEGLPVVIMEAMALGRPVISTYVAGIPELVEPGKTGWLVPASDEVALSEAMRAALEAPVEQLAGMGAAGRNRVIERHDSLKEAGKLKRLFEERSATAPVADELQPEALTPRTTRNDSEIDWTLLARTQKRVAAERAKRSTALLQSWLRLALGSALLF